MDSEEDFYYSSGDDAAEDFAEYSSEDDNGGDEEHYIIPKKYYTVLKEETLKQLQENDISQVCSFLAVSRGIACTLLLRKRWSVSSVFEDWFADEDRVRDAVGISNKQNRKPSKHKTYCKICMEKVKNNRMSSAACGHLYCKDCWTNYVASSISGGPECLRLRCPEPKCAVVAGLDMVEAVAAADDKRRFYQYLHRSYVECSRNRKWCPKPGCNYAVEFDGGEGEETYDVTCGCRHKFCWGCTEEQHRPLGCETVAKWGEKNTSEAENNDWILVNTKPCPKCDKKIEKNQGCNHMTCKCGHEFCWICLGKWKNQNHVCNKFHIDEEEARDSSLEETRKALKRYAHYYERFAANHKSSEIARGDLVRARNEHLPKLSKEQDMPETELEFVMEAWDQIVECRRVLKWSYVFGYYLKPEEPEKIEFFDFLQGQAESALERLHHCTEKEMKKFLEPCQPSESFADFRVELNDLTLITKKYFENLIRALENDLVEVEGVGSK